MKSLSTEYLGLKLRNPIIIGSSPLTGNIDSLKKAEDAGAGAVVLRSIFEEQILNRTKTDMDNASNYLTHADAYGFLENASKEHYIDQYLLLVEKAKKELGIPVIASINCTSDASWLDYAQRFELCGADALELNYYVIAGDAKKSGAELEKKYLSVAKTTRKQINLPLSMKIGWNFTSIANIVKSFSDLGFDGIVLFNHFFRPDIDIDKIAVCSDKIIQPKGDFAETLRWTAMMSSEIKADICASTGIRDGETLIKMLLAGAKAVQICSVLYSSGYGAIGQILTTLEQWMDKHGFESIEDFRAKLSQEKIGEPEEWERTQFIKLQENQK